VFAGVEFPPSAITDAEKRYRILQAAGRYRATPRAVIEELQLVLTGTKTVYLGYHTPDQWHYAVATLDSETPDPDAVERAVLAQKPVGMLAEIVSRRTTGRGSCSRRRSMGRRRRSTAWTRTSWLRRRTRTTRRSSLRSATTSILKTTTLTSRSTDA
jgi:hypothetical protein